MDNIQSDKCPLCGGANQCAIAAGKPPEQCWCMSADISPQSRVLLPDRERGVRCICPACGRIERTSN